MEKTVYPRKANYYETDMMGVVHHSNHIRYFEESRIFFMRNIGCDVMEMEQKGIIIPNVDAYAKYHSPIRFDDEIEIEILKMRKAQEEEAIASFDGQPGTQLSPGDRVRIYRSEERTRMIKLFDVSFYKVLRDKIR